LWQEFELGATAEARFAQAVDRAIPVLLNLQNGGGSWLEHGITYDRVVKRIEPQINAGCPELWAYLAERLSEARTKGFFPAD
jgi:putative hydrolase of HD superfamily